MIYDSRETPGQVEHVVLPRFETSPDNIVFNAVHIEDDDVYLSRKRHSTYMRTKLLTSIKWSERIACDYYFYYLCITSRMVVESAGNETRSKVSPLFWRRLPSPRIAEFRKDFSAHSSGALCHYQ